MLEKTVIISLDSSKILKENFKNLLKEDQVVSVNGEFVGLDAIRYRCLADSKENLNKLLDGVFSVPENEEAPEKDKESGGIIPDPSDGDKQSEEGE